MSVHAATTWATDAEDTLNQRRTRLIGDSHAISEVVETCIQVAASDATVLLLGETGTGKELLARAIHEHSGRRGDFVAINCGAITESLIESELFGHVQGAFTGATASKPGLFRSADGGTLLLDEIGSLPPHAQHSLLRVLQEDRVRPVGASEEIPIDVRVIAATSVPLHEAMERGEFREDLFYRLDVIRVVVPPLRNRQEDILPLFGHFCARHAEHHQVERPRISPQFERALLDYAWPGNVRQLENLTERLVLTCPDTELTADDFHRHVGERARPQGAAAEAAPRPASPSGAPQSIDLSQPLANFLDQWEARYLEAALGQTGGHVQDAAQLAGLSRRTLSRRIRKFGLHTRVGAAPRSATPLLWLSGPPLDPVPLRPGAGEVAVGRNSSCDLVLTLPGVSRVHATLRETSAGWELSDNGSRNGTFLNGRVLEEPVVIAEGDVVGIGPLLFRVTRSGSAPDSHHTTSTHLVSVKLDRVPLAVILERFRARSYSARLNLGSHAGSGTIKIHEGEVAWACYTHEGEVVEGDDALPKLLDLEAGLCVVTAGENASEVKAMLRERPGDDEA